MCGTCVHPHLLMSNCVTENKVQCVLNCSYGGGGSGKGERERVDLHTYNFMLYCFNHNVCVI